METVLIFVFQKNKKVTLQGLHNKQHIRLFMVSSLLLSDLTRNVYPKKISLIFIKINFNNN